MKLDFYEQQERAKRDSRLLSIWFVAAVIGVGLGIYLLFASVFVFFYLADAEHKLNAIDHCGKHWVYLHDEDRFTTIDSDAPQELKAIVASYGHATLVDAPPSPWTLANIFDFVFQPVPILITVAIVSAIILLASWAELMQLNEKGGLRIAERVGARYIAREPEDQHDRRLANIVEEMTIAADVTKPALFIMDNEKCINTFIAGRTERDAALVVSRGAVERLSRDELQAVVAHELSHMACGDMSLNLRMLGLLGGILFIHEFGMDMLWPTEANEDCIASREAAAGLARIFHAFLGERHCAMAEVLGQ